MQSGSDRLGEVFFALCKAVDTPVSLGLWLRYKHRCFNDLVRATVDPRHYLEEDVDKFQREYGLVSFFSKYKGFELNIDLEAVALESFAASELNCLATNRRLRKDRSQPITGWRGAAIHAAQRKIASVLGPFSLFAVQSFFGWGPGATFDLPRSRALPDSKLVAYPFTVGSRATTLASSVITSDLHWSEALLGQVPDGPWSLAPWSFEITDRCRVTTVPKSAKTNRTIAIEPTLNLFLQKGFGGYIRSRLKRYGVDLDNQAVNQTLAREAIRLGLATLDLSAASDSVSKELVYELLPYDWAEALDSIRSREALLPDGTVVQLEKFSSMGNGFTFELESLIFWAVVSAVRDEFDPGSIVSIYGDDILCSRSAAPHVIDMLDYLGFKTNPSKSFIDGLFYESCGKHWFLGHDVTPLYQKEPVEDAREWIRFHNRVTRWLQRCLSPLPAVEALLQRIGRDIPFRIPYGAEGDDGILVPVEALQGRPWDANHGIECLVFRNPMRSLPAIEQSMLALWFRRVEYIFGHGSVSDSEAFDGNIRLPEKTGILNLRDLRRSRRWIYPSGVSICPR